MHLTSPSAGHTLSLLKCGFFSRPAPGHRDVRHVPTQATSTAGGPSGRSVGQTPRKESARCAPPQHPASPQQCRLHKEGTPGGSQRAPGVRRAVRGGDGGRTGKEPPHTLRHVPPLRGPRSGRALPPASCGAQRRMLRRQRGPARPPASQARAALSTGPGTLWEREVAGPAGRKRGHWAGTVSPRSVRPGARGAGLGPGSSPPAQAAPPSRWLWLGCASRSAIRGGNDGDHGTPGAVSSEAVATGTEQGLVAPRFRLQRSGSLRAAPSTRRPGAGRDPTPHRAVSPRCPPSPPGRPPLSREVPTLGPRPQFPSASWAV